MLKPLQGLALATFMSCMPLAAQADCPPEASIDRYAQTARDALQALDGLVPESQQQTLEDRYAAMLILKWNWQGRDGIVEDPTALQQLVSCYGSGQCGLDGSNEIDAQIVSYLNGNQDNPSLIASLIPRVPSDTSLQWAGTVLDCDLGIDIAPETPPEAETPSEDVLDTDTQTADEPLELAATGPGTEAEISSTDVEAPISEAPIELAETDEDISAPEPSSPLPVAEDLDLVETAPTSNTTAEDMFQTAAALMVSGKPGEAIPLMREACILDAVETQTSQACATLFDLYTADQGTAGPDGQNTKAYLALSEQLCDLAYRTGCTNISAHYRPQVTPKAHKAVVLFADKSCALGDAQACAEASSYYLTGRASEPDPALARERLEQSCTFGRLESCQEVADFYLRGLGGDIDEGRAFEINRAACPSGDSARADLCVAAADFVLINMESGQERAGEIRDLIKRSCELGHDVGCAWYAEDLELGLGGAIDLEGAKQARLTACEYGHETSCKTDS
ncbi:MAG: hypothetical protein AAGB16_08455 [Pseudomonadota bacterium]